MWCGDVSLSAHRHLTCLNILEFHILPALDMIDHTRRTAVHLCNIVLADVVVDVVDCDSAPVWSWRESDQFEECKGMGMGMGDGDGEVLDGCDQEWS